MKFSAPDQDNDIFAAHCSVNCKGAFWYDDCFYTNPLGVYDDNTTNRVGVIWSHWKGWNISVDVIKF